MLGMLSKAFSYKGKELMRSLYCTYVRPHLEFAIQGWNPQFLQKILKALESVQKRSSKQIPELRHLTYVR
jgi:ribonuclease P/MRP protein subunit RPP40